jgi:hypothetical protein
MHGQEQHVLLGGQAYQGCPDQGPLRQIETPSHFLPRQCLDLGLTHGCRQPLPINHRQGKGEHRPDYLAWLLRNLDKSRAPNSMAPGDLLQALRQSRHV